MPNEHGDFKPTVDWMRTKYTELNNTLFRGELGDCDFGIFTTGKGSEGGVLGWFKITTRGLKISRATRRLYIRTYGGDEYIDRKNFVRICKPKIELNGNYTGAENSFLATLAHEMCHYYNYMDGYCPKQAHGPEFRYIGSIISQRSNGLFTIQRLASAEQMSGLNLNDEMKAKKDKRLNNKKASATAILITRTDGSRRLAMVNSYSMLSKFIKYYSGRFTENILTSNDPNLINELFDRKYCSIMRSLSYWNIKDVKWIDDLFAKSYYEVVYGNDKKLTPKPIIDDKPKKKTIFSINTNNGKLNIEVQNEQQLKAELKKRFPFLSDETLAKIMQNKANYKMEENKININKIIKETVNKFLDEEFGDNSIELDPNMNLGIESPLEIE